MTTAYGADARPLEAPSGARRRRLTTCARSSRRLGDAKVVYLVALRDVDRRRLRHRGARRGREGGRRARRRRRRLEPRRRADRDRRLGGRRGRLRLAEGADDAAGPRDGVRLGRGARSRGRVDVAALLLRLGARRGPPSTSSTRRSRPSVSLVAGLDVALGLMLEEGLEACFDRHVRLGRACRDGAKAMGLELFSPDEDRSAVVTAIRSPEGIDGKDVVRVASRPLRDHDRERPGPADGQDLSARPHRLVRRVRHRHRSSGPSSSRWSSSGPRSSAASGSPARSRRTPTAPACEGPRPGDDRRRGRRAAAREVRRRRHDATATWRS